MKAASYLIIAVLKLCQTIRHGATVVDSRVRPLVRIESKIQPLSHSPALFPGATNPTSLQVEYQGQCHQC